MQLVSNSKRRLRKSRSLWGVRQLNVERLEDRRVLSGNPVCETGGSGLHTIPFEVNGSGEAPNGIPVIPGLTSPHFATGEMKRLATC